MEQLVTLILVGCALNIGGYWLGYITAKERAANIAEGWGQKNVAHAIRRPWS